MDLSKDQEAIANRGLLDRPSVLMLPTGGGKTWLSRLAIRISLERGLKAVYLAPLRAIAKELGWDWRQEFHGYKVGIYTGEVGTDDLIDNPSAAEADVLIATPEKFDLYLRTWGKHLGWLAKVDLLVVDELHMMGVGRRGATLEGLITRLGLINPYARVLSLSATLGNPEELAAWMRGEAFTSTNRPIPLAWGIRTFSKADDKSQIVQDECKRIKAGGGQVIVFVQSRPRSVSLAEDLCKAGLRASPHNAGLARQARDHAERQFRDRSLDVIVATPTLAMGVNLPARAVIIHDLQRWEKGEWRDLDVNSVWQLAGRAGRKGMDSAGEVVLLAPKWNQRAAKVYLKGVFEAIKSPLQDDQQFYEQLLVAIGCGLARSEEQAERAMQRTFANHQKGSAWTKQKCSAAIAAMVEAGMMEVCDDGSLKATRLGWIAVRFQLTPRTVIAWSNFEGMDSSATLFDLLLAVCTSPDFNSRLRVEFEELDRLQQAFDSEPCGLRVASDEERRAIIHVTQKDLVAAVKTALVIKAWTRLGDKVEVAELFGCQSHDVEEAHMEAARLIQALVAMLDATEVAKERESMSHQDRMASEPSLLEKARALGAMVCCGLDDEASTLAMVEGIGPIMARRLRDNGIEDVEALALARSSELQQVQGISVQRAEKWIAEAGELTSQGGAFRFKEVLNKAIPQQAKGIWPEHVDYYRWRRAQSLSVSKHVDSSWTVTGGSEPHRVIHELGMGYQCDCQDAAKGKLCKHKLAVMHLTGERDIPRFDRLHESKTISFDLQSLWRAYGWK